MLRRPDVGCGAARCKEQDLIARVQLGHGMGDNHHSTVAVGQSAECIHQLPIQRRVETGRRLVQYQQCRFRQQLKRHRHPFALAAGQMPDPGVDMVHQSELAYHRVHLEGAFGRRGVRGEA